MQRFEAKSVEEALKEACRVKGVTLDELKYYVIEEKPGGLFGIGSKGVVEAFTYNDVQQFLEQYVSAYFNNINMPVEVIVNRSENNEFKIVINADNNAILIGKKHTAPIVEGLLNGGMAQENIFVVNSLEEATVILGQIGRMGDTVLFENDLPDNYSENQ